MGVSPHHGVRAGTDHAVQRRPRGMTVVELMVVVAILGIVLALTASVYRYGTRLSRQTACLSNLRQLALALNTYFTEYHELPPDDSPGRFDEALLPLVKDRGIFHCPADPRKDASSYAPYYVHRREMNPQDFMLGCPRHAGGQVGTVLFGSAGAEGNRLGEITRNGQPVKVGDRVTGGMLLFADGSAASMHEGTSVDVVTSFQRGDGSYYHILRLPMGETGGIGLAVHPRSRLEVITPAAVAGSEGTVFYVLVYEGGEDTHSSLVYVKKGSVRATVRGRRMAERLLQDGEAVLAGSPSGTIVDCKPPTKKHLPALPKEKEYDKGWT